jgi:ribokinase
MKSGVVTGYASLDHVIVLDGEVRPGRTTTIVDRSVRSWPRLGGGPAYVALAVHAATPGAAVPLTFVGEDALGDGYRRELEAKGLSAAGTVSVRGARTPIAVLAYDQAGDCACLYDPGLPSGVDLDQGQRHLLAAADWICVTIGPPAVTDSVLGLIRDDQKLAWVVKNDPKAITPQQSAALYRRADLVFCNAAERLMLDEAQAGDVRPRPGRIVIETQGRRGAIFHRGGESRLVPAEPVEVTDPTGAGDTFAGGVIAAILKGETDLEAIGRAGHAAARALLLERQAEESSKT